MPCDDKYFLIKSKEPNIYLWPEINCEGTPTIFKSTNEDGDPINVNKIYTDFYGLQHLDSDDINKYNDDGTYDLYYMPWLRRVKNGDLVNAKSAYIPPHLEVEWTGHNGYYVNVCNNPDYAQLQQKILTNSDARNYNSDGSPFYKNLYEYAGGHHPHDCHLIESKIDDDKLMDNLRPEEYEQIMGSSKLNDYISLFSKIRGIPSYDGYNDLYSHIPNYYTTYSNRLRTLRVKQKESWDQFKLNCCRNLGDETECGIWWGGNTDGSCDSVMQDWCHYNLNDPSCNCINSKESFPSCFDVNCVSKYVREGELIKPYQTKKQKDVKNKGCPNITACFQETSIGGNENILDDAKLKQYCRSSSVENTLCDHYCALNEVNKNNIKDQYIINTCSTKCDNKNYGENNTSNNNELEFPPITDPRWNKLEISDSLSSYDGVNTNILFLYIILFIILIYFLSSIINIFGGFDYDEYEYYQY